MGKQYLRRFGGLCWLIVLFAVSDGTHAASFTLKELGNGVDAIFIEGDIQEGDDVHFRRLAVASKSAMIILASPGGSLTPALEIGKTIQLQGFSTYVPANVDCTSACALIWAAGSNRFVASSGRVGFHASYRDIDGQPVEVGSANALVGRYLTLLNLPEKAVLFATSASPANIQWLNRANATQAGIPFQILDLPEDNNASSDTQASSASTETTSGFDWHDDIWNVGTDDEKKSCTLSASFSVQNGINNTSVIALTAYPKKTGAFLFIIDEKFKSISAEEQYQIGIVLVKGNDIDDGWGTLTFTGMDVPNLGKGIGVSLNYPTLIADLQKDDDIGFFKDGKLVDAFPLKGAKVGIVQFERCLQGLTPPGLSDPFAN